MNSLYLPRHDAFLRWYTIGATGPSVVWLPGLGMPAVGNFLPVVTDPANPAMRSVLVDFLGTGMSDPARDPLRTIGDHAEYIADLLDHLGMTGCSVLGYSMGGTIAIELACKRPDLVARLVLAEANLKPGGGTASRRIASVSFEEFASDLLPKMLSHLRESARDGDAVDGFIAGAWGRADPRALHDAALVLVDLPGDFCDRFLALGMPRSFVIGERNLPRPGETGSADVPDPARLAAAGVDVRVMDGVGDDLMLADPSGFARLVTDTFG